LACRYLRLIRGCFHHAETDADLRLITRDEFEAGGLPRANALRHSRPFAAAAEDNLKAKLTNIEELEMKQAFENSLRDVRDQSIEVDSRLELAGKLAQEALDDPRISGRAKLRLEFLLAMKPDASNMRALHEVTNPLDTKIVDDRATLPSE